MPRSRAFEVRINIYLEDTGSLLWSVTTQEALQQVVWTGDGETLDVGEGLTSALDCASSELRHLLAGGHVEV